jgi:hypothetical protein
VPLRVYFVGPLFGNLACLAKLWNAFHYPG